jgi:hypothetical protein
MKEFIKAVIGVRRSRVAKSFDNASAKTKVEVHAVFGSE